MPYVQFNGALRDIDRENNILFIFSLFLFNSLFDCLMYTKTCNDIKHREYNMTCFLSAKKTSMIGLNWLAPH